MLIQLITNIIVSSSHNFCHFDFCTHFKACKNVLAHNLFEKFLFRWKFQTQIFYRQRKFKKYYVQVSFLYALTYVQKSKLQKLWDERSNWLDYLIKEENQS